MHPHEPVNPLFEAAREFQAYCADKKWKFCFVGGLAVLRWGEIRMTQDIDLCLLCGFGSESVFIEPLLRDFQSRLSNSHEFAIQNRVLLLSASNGVSIDVALSGLTYEEQMMQRGSCFEFLPQLSLFTCSAEDLIIAKSFADRPKDWLDIEGIIIRQSPFLDRAYIFEKLEPLCMVKEAPEIMVKLDGLFKNLAR